jgi:hypothetical protein
VDALGIIGSLVELPRSTRPSVFDAGKLCAPRIMTAIGSKASKSIKTYIYIHTVTAVSICDDERKGVKSDNTLTLEMAKAIDTHEGRSISI